MAKNYKDNFKDADGVWRTVGGRRIFIRNGQDLASAMKESGKFNLSKKQKKVSDELNEKARQRAQDDIKEYLNGNNKDWEEDGDFIRDLASEYNLELDDAKAMFNVMKVDKDARDMQKKIDVSNKKSEVESSKRELLSKVYSQYPDISEEDEDYLNNLSYEELKQELKDRGWDKEPELNKSEKDNSEFSIHDDYISTIAPYDDTEYAYASKQGDKWLVKNPIKGEYNTKEFSSKEEAIQEMKSINDHIRSGDTVMSNEGITKHYQNEPRQANTNNQEPSNITSLGQYAESKIENKEAYSKSKALRDKYIMSDGKTEFKEDAMNVWYPGYKEPMQEQVINKINDGDDYDRNEIQNTLAKINFEDKYSLHNEFLSEGGPRREQYYREKFGDAKVDSAIMKEQELLHKGYKNINTSLEPSGVVNSFDYSDMIISGERNGVKVTFNYNKEGKQGISLNSVDKNGGVGTLVITDDNRALVRDITSGGIGSFSNYAYKDYETKKLYNNETKEYYDKANKYYNENKDKHFYDNKFFNDYNEKVKDEIIARRNKSSMNDTLRRKAYQKYMKEHPNSKKSFNDFMK